MKNKDKIVFTGGSRIGPVNETFPFSKLIVGHQKLTLKTTFSGTLDISSQDLLAAKEVFYVPILAQGIKILHKNPNYNETLIFWSFKDPKKILKALEEKELVSPTARPGPGRENRESSGSEHSKRIKFLTSPLFFAFVAAMLLFAGFMEYKARQRYANYTTMGKASGYQLEVEKMSIDHGAAFLNDSIIVPTGTKLVSEKPGWFNHKTKPLFGGEYPMPPAFANLEAPFKVIKDPDSFNLQVMKFGDTLVFNIPDPNFKDPRDPTFRDLFDRFFN